MVEIQSDPYAEYLDFEVFKETFGKGISVSALSQASKAIDNLPKWDLEHLVHLLYKKWPHNRDMKAWKLGIRRAIQARFYKLIYGHDPSPEVLARDKEAEELLKLLEEPPEETKIKREPKEKKVKMTKNKPVPGETVTPIVPADSPILPKKEKSEFSKKVSGMSLEEVIKWATEVGVEAEKIDKHKSKPLGLAKMNISNMIRAKVEKKGEDK